MRFVRITAMTLFVALEAAAGEVPGRNDARATTPQELDQMFEVVGAAKAEVVKPRKVLHRRVSMKKRHVAGKKLFFVLTLMMSFVLALLAADRLGRRAAQHLWIRLGTSWQPPSPRQRREPNMAARPQSIHYMTSLRDFSDS